MYVGKNFAATSTRLARTFGGQAGNKLELQLLEAHLPKGTFDNVKFQRRGLCHLAAFEYVREFAKGSSSIQEKKTKLTDLAPDLLKSLTHSAIGSPCDFEAVQPDAERLKEVLKQGRFVVLQGFGREPLCAADSMLLTACDHLHTQHIFDAGFKVSADHKYWPNHSVVLIGFSDAANPLPGVPLEHALILDQDPFRQCFKGTGIDPEDMHSLNKDELRSKGLISLMLRTAAVEDILDSKNVSQMMLAPLLSTMNSSAAK